jgi:hypothetical protein
MNIVHVWESMDTEGKPTLSKADKISKYKQLLAVWSQVARVGTDFAYFNNQRIAEKFAKLLLPNEGFVSPALHHITQFATQWGKDSLHTFVQNLASLVVIQGKKWNQLNRSKMS